jgi:putative DNA primase/helicase
LVVDQPTSLNGEREDCSIGETEEQRKAEMRRSPTANGGEHDVTTPTPTAAPTPAGTAGGNGAQPSRQGKASRAKSKSAAKRTLSETPPDVEAPAAFIHRLTDVGNGKRLVARHGMDIRYCWPWKKWLVWDGKRWKIDDTGTVVLLAKQTVRSIYAEVAGCEDKSQRKAVADWARASERRERLSAMIDLARSEPGIPILPADLDRDPWLLNCPNGTLDLRAGELRKHSRADRITKLCPTAYDPAAEFPVWLAFLDRVFAGNLELIAFVQRLLGHCQTGSVQDHVLPVFWGSGANGKSTLIGAVMDVMGPDYSMKAPRDLLMMRKGEHHPTELTDLFGKRFVAAVETAEGQRLDEALVKDLTGGDRIRARRMREDHWEFEPTHKLILATNHRPEIRDTTHSTWRRVKLIPFTVTIPNAEQDRDLSRKLRAERAGILAWMVRGAMGWRESGLAEPDCVKIATSEYRAEEDKLGTFLEECCVTGPNERERAGTLYKAYKAWCERNGENSTTQTRFGKALTERGFEREKAGVYWYKGVALETDLEG